MAYIEYVHIRPRSDVLITSLASGIGFNADELMANREGKIHKHQFDRMLKDELGMKLIGLGMTLLMGLVFRLSWVVSVEKRSIWKFFWRTLQNPMHFLNHVIGGLEEPLPVVVQIILLAFPVIVISQLFKIPWLLVLDLLSRKVLKEGGSVSARWDEKRLKGKGGREGDLVSSYVYTIKNRTFPVTRSGYEALISTIDYNLYYLPRTRCVLSAEPMDSETSVIKEGPHGLQVVRTQQTDLVV